MSIGQCTAALLALLSATVHAQGAPDSSRIIRGVEVVRLNVFSPEEARSTLTRLANSLHRTTRGWVVERELLFRAGMEYDSARVAETARNLRSVGVFRMVAVDSVRTDSGLIMRVTTGDGWTTRPDFRFGVTGSSVTYTASIDELNFLGTATQLGVRYRKDPDRWSIIGSFRQPRLFWRTVGISLAYYHLSDGDIALGALSRPFFSLSDRTGWNFGGDVRKHRILRFFFGEKAARDTLQRRFAMAYGSFARAVQAGPGGYLRLGINGHVRRDDYAVEARADTIGKTITGVAGAFLQWRRARFLVSKGLTAFGREEDVDVSTALAVGVNLTPRAFGYREDGIVPNASFLTGFGKASGFVQLYGSGSLRFTSAGLDSGTVQVAATGYLVPAARHLAVLHGSAGWQKNPAPGGEFDLGLGVGPRAFRQHAFTGDRAFLATAEYRFTLAEEVLKVSAIGLAGFVDYGGAWWHDQPRRSGWDLGIGLRFGPTRATNIKSTRMDLAYRVKNDAQPGGWVFVVGAGFAFLPSFRLAP